MDTLLILVGAWLALIVVVVVAWHPVMKRAHRQDLRHAPHEPLPGLTPGARFPLPRTASEVPVSRTQA